MGAIALLDAVDRAQQAKAQQAAGPQLAQLQAADPSRGYNTPYYEAFTNSGDVAARFYANPGQNIRLVDPKTGQIYAQGTGPEGAQQIATLATQLGKDLGRKAQWQIQQQTGDDQYQVVGYDRYDPKNNILKQVVRIAAPLLGAAIPGIGPLLGAALGGFGGTVATGGNLKEALLAGATSALGNSLGGALSGALRGAPVSFAGTNPLAGVGSALKGGGSLTDALLGGAGADSIVSGVTEVAPLTIAGGASPGLVTSLLSGAGTGLGGVLNAGTGNDRLIGDNAMNDRILTGQQPTSATSNQQPTTLDEVVVEGTRPTDLGYIDDLAETGLASYNNSAWARRNAGQQPLNQSMGDFLRDTVGQTLGGVGADMITANLASWLMPTGNLDGVPDGGYNDAPAVGPKTGTVFDPYMPSDAGGGDTAAPPQLPMANSGAGMPGGGGGGGGAAPALMSAENPGAAGPAPSAAGSDFKSEGSFAPDIYPWRKALAEA